MAASRQKTDYVHIAGSALVSGIVGVTVPFPFNVVRCLQQTQRQTSTSVVRAMRGIVRGQGVRGLYRGYATSLCLYAPATSVFYLCYFRSSELLTAATGRPEASSFAGGIIANACAGLLWTPMDNVVQRCWVAAGRQQPWAVARGIYRGSGLAGFWRAYPATLGVWAPLSGVFFAAYEGFMAQAHRRRLVQSPSAQHAVELGASALAATVAVVCTNPIDVCRVRFQVASQANWLSVVRNALHQEGWRLLTIGLRARLLAVVPDLTVGMTVFEAAYRMLGDRV